MQELIKKSMIQHQKRFEDRVLERNKMVNAQKHLEDHLYFFYMSMYQITKKMLAYYQHITKHNAFQVVSQAEAAYLTNSESESAKLFITILKKEFIHRYTYVHPHIPQFNSSYSSTPTPSPSTSFLSSHHIEH